MPHKTHALSSSQSDSPEITQPVVWLEVARGRTRYPRRPVTQSRFLIGAGSNCALQLGGEGVPFLHSMMLTEPGRISIESFVPSPPLTINGETVRSAELHDGDLLAIGEFEFNIHIDASAIGREVSAPLTGEDSGEELLFDDEDLSELSAAELVNRLELEMDDIDEFEESCRSGVAALLDAAWLAGEPSRSGATEGAPAVEESADGELEESLLEEMLELSHELETRLAQLREVEEVQAGRGASLLEAQDQLVDQLARLKASLAEESLPKRARA
ncbi:MAG: FHA domain-containing protein [Planctomycetaceae bacterium]